MYLCNPTRLSCFQDHIASGAPGRCKLSVHIPSAAPTPADTPDTSVADTAEGEDTPYNGPQPVTVSSSTLKVYMYSLVLI